MQNTEVLIIGGGPAGITAAIYLKRSNIPFLIVEKYIVGGKTSLTSTIENYPGFNQENGADFALGLQKQLKFNDIDVSYDEIKKLEKIDGNFIAQGIEETYKAKYVVVATGTEEKRLNLANENRFIGKGISFCAVCDGAFYKNKVVALIGGGNSAFEEAIYLSTLAKEVHLIHRREEFKAEETLIEKIKQCDNVFLHTPYIVKKYIGENKISGLELENVITKETNNLNIDGVFLYIGLEPKIEFIKCDIKNNFGFIVTDDSMESSVENLFAIGDIKDKTLRQIVTATSDGAIAAFTIKNRIGNRKNEEKRNIHTES